MHADFVVVVMDREAGDSPRLTTQGEPLSFAMQAQLIGILEIDRLTNCLVVRTGNMLVDVAWPLGWSVAVRAGEIALIDAAGRVVGKLGDEVRVGGGSVDAAQANIVSCTGRTEVFLASGLSGT